MGLSLAHASTHPIPEAPNTDVEGYLQPFWANLRDHFAGYETVHISFDYKGDVCEIPVTAPKRPANSWKPKILALHGITDSQEGFFPWIAQLRRSNSPYAENFIMLDWPHNGEARCSQAKTPEEIAEVIHRTLQLFAAEKKIPFTAPELIVGHSMGAFLSTILVDKYFRTSCLAAIAPALPTKDGLTHLQRIIGSAKSLKDAEQFAHYIRNNGRPMPLAWLTHRRLIKRMKEAAPLLNSMTEADLKRMNERLSRIPPTQYLWIAQGRTDLLTPAEFTTPLLKSRFFGQLQSLSCAHNMTRECPELIPALRPELCPGMVLTDELL